MTNNDIGKKLQQSFKDAINEEFSANGISENDMAKILNWSLNRLRRTMAKPLQCRGGFRATFRLLAALGIVSVRIYFSDSEL